jgi:hypothetical protein
MILSNTRTSVVPLIEVEFELIFELNNQRSLAADSTVFLALTLRLCIFTFSPSIKVSMIFS